MGLKKYLRMDKIMIHLSFKRLTCSSRVSLITVLLIWEFSFIFLKIKSDTVYRGIPLASTWTFIMNKNSKIGIITLT